MRDEREKRGGRREGGRRLNYDHLAATDRTKSSPNLAEKLAVWFFGIMLNLARLGKR